MELNDEQKVAKDKIINWYYNSNNQIFFLSGYAGTGKSTLISYVLQNELHLSLSRVKFCAPTGKAATVLLNKGNRASTIHKLIYTTKKDEYGNIEFIKVPNIDADLIIVDEFSMVNMDIFEDLKSYNIKILAVGDNAQLPPVNADQLNYLNNPDAQLTQIMRQNENSDILKIAEKVRLKKPILPKKYNDVIILNKKLLSNDDLLEILSSCDQIIAGSNNTCKKINDSMRNFYGRKNKIPQKGDKIICLQNNYAIEIDDNVNLINGIIGTCEGFHITNDKNMIGFINFKPDFVDNTLYNLVCDPYPLMNLDTPFAKYQEYYELYNNQILPKMKNIRPQSAPLKLMNKFDYGYCITCHKAQGSEWDSVAIFDESSYFGDLSNNWLYTAVTRAKKLCIIIK